MKPSTYVLTTPARRPLTIANPLKAIGWLVVIGAGLYYIVGYALRYLLLEPATFGRHWGHAGILVLHVGCGIAALVLGAPQFSTALRRKYVSVHRNIGRLYLISVGIGALSAAYLLLIPERSVGFHLGISGLALAWIVTSGLAFVAVRRRHFEQHREWMIRSYVVTFGFVNFRLLTDLLAAMEVNTPDRLAIVSFGCWAFPLLLTEAVLQGRKIFAAPARVRERPERAFGET
jgi:uncharacterized membrane protein